MIKTALLGTVGFTLFALNLVLWIIPFYIVALAKLIPVRRWQITCDRGLSALAEYWIECNNVIAGIHDIEWDERGGDGLRRDGWYLINCNHQSWVDIFVVQHALSRRVPFLKFFIKRQLIWVPLLGLAWWALDMPFMHRHSKEAMRRNPALRGQDLDATRKACQHFRAKPTSIINFVEGTRFTPEKHRKQESPYRHLLRPRAGGVAFVLSTMGDVFDCMLNVTIVYPHPQVTFWQLLSGQLKRIVVRIEPAPIPAELIGGDYMNDPEFRARLQAWVSELWEQKDALIEDLTANQEPRETART